MLRNFRIQSLLQYELASIYIEELKNYTYIIYRNIEWNVLNLLNYYLI